MIDPSFQEVVSSERWSLPMGQGRLRTAFFGREAEVERLERLLADPTLRLVTLTGSGGVGKTRLAQAIAEHPTFSAIAAFVPLADVQDQAHVPTAILRVLGLEAMAGQSVHDVVVASLQGRRTLLVLDNLEHVAAAGVVADLLERCPDLQVLATARVPLGLTGEQRFPLEPLVVAESPNLSNLSDSPAVRLFVDRVQLIQPAFQLTASNLGDVAFICRQVDGLPLAIELAAGHCRQVSPASLAERLRTRVALPPSSLRDVPLRQQSIHATVNWSLGLLDPSAARLWRALGVYESGFVLEAAEAVASSLNLPLDAVPTTLDLLEVHDLIGLRANALGEPRYRMLRVAREVALDAFRRDPACLDVLEACARFTSGFCAAAQPGLMGPDGMSWFLRVEAELPTIRAVLNRDLAAGNIERPMAMAGHLHWFWTDPGYLHEGQDWLDNILARDTDEIPVGTRASAYAAASSIANWLGDLDPALHHAGQALALYEAAGDRSGTMDAMLHLGNIAFDGSDYPEAERWFREGQALALARQEPWAMPAFANLIGLVNAAQGSYAAAVGWHRAAIAGWRANGYESHVAVAEGSLAWALLAQHQVAEAVAIMRSLQQRIDLEATSAESTVYLLDCAILASLGASPLVAVRLFAVSARYRHELGSPHRPYIEASTRDRLAALRSNLGEAAFGRAWSEGGAMTAASTATTIADLLASIDAHAWLTGREREVLLLLVEGASDNEIADRLYITRRTASKHVAAILEKLGAPNRTTAVVLAYRRGLVQQ